MCRMCLEGRDDKEQDKQNEVAQGGRSDTEMLVSAVMVELMVVQAIHSVQEVHSGVASEAVDHHGIVAMEATWMPHSHFLHLVGPLRWAVRALDFLIDVLNPGVGLSLAPWKIYIQEKTYKLFHAQLLVS
jgi:hypothetical protein